LSDDLPSLKSLRNIKLLQLAAGKTEYFKFTALKLTAYNLNEIDCAKNFYESLRSTEFGSRTLDPRNS